MSTNLDEVRLIRLAELAEAGIAAAALVHEVRQPLFALRTMAQLGRRSADGVAIDDLLALVDHLEGLLAAWSDVGRREEPRLYDVREVVDRVVRMLEGRRRQVHAELELVGGDGVLVEGSPSVTRQVALNLLSNGLDAVAEAQRRDVLISIERDEDRVRITVEDTGPGVPDAVVGRMFEPFVTSKSADEGTGLGLYVAHQLCLENGGSLVHEPLENGTRMVAQFSVGPMKKA